MWEIFFKSMLIPCSIEPISEAYVSFGHMCLGDSLGLEGACNWINISLHFSYFLSGNVGFGLVITCSIPRTYSTCSGIISEMTGFTMGLLTGCI